MAPPSLANLDRLATLRAMLDRWAAEYQGILASDPVRAVDHMQAIADLHRLIISLELRESVESRIPVSRFTTSPSAPAGWLHASRHLRTMPTSSAQRQECVVREDSVCMFCKLTIRNGAMAIRSRQDDWQIEAFGLDKRLWHPECWGRPHDQADAAT